MSKWQPIETAPRDKHLLLFGAQKPPFDRGIHIVDPLVFSGYWDNIDSAWCAHGSTASGPFFHATHWKPLPNPPEMIASNSPRHREDK